MAKPISVSFLNSITSELLTMRLVLIGMIAKRIRRLRPKISPERTCVRAFTLLELLVVIALIAILLVAILPGLSRARQHARAAACRTHLRQIGLAMIMYVSDSSRYPPLWDEESSEMCFDKLRAYYPLDWTSSDWHCPTYIASRGEVYRDRDGSAASSYAYNWRGTVGWRGCPKEIYQLKLGLGHLSKDAIHEPEALVPSEMYVIADARPGAVASGISGNPKMELYAFSGLKEMPAPHRQAYNILLGDGHVSLTARSDYLYPPRAAHHWNRDNQPHPETWAPVGQWAVQN